MDCVSGALSRLRNLPDPLVYSLIAIIASGAVYSTVHHVENWRPRKTKRVKLRGVEGRMVEDSLASWSLGTLARSTNFNVAFAARKILVERALQDKCKDLLISRLESTRQQTRMSALVTIRYVFDFKHKTRSFPLFARSPDFVPAFQDSNTLLQLINFAYGDYESFLLCLNNSIDDPLSTRLTISNICFLMRTHKSCRGYYAENDLFRRWRENPRNPLYSKETIEGIVIVHTDESTADIFLPEVQQFIYYISEQNWPLDESLPSRVRNRFKSIWAINADEPTLPFHDPGERWFSDRESAGSEVDEEGDEEGFDGNFEDYLLGVAEEDEEGGELDLLEEPEALTEEDLMAYFNAAEVAGLASQDRRRNARRLGAEHGNQ